MVSAASYAMSIRSIHQAEEVMVDLIRAGIVDLPLLAEARPELLSAAAASATESSEPPAT